MRRWRLGLCRAGLRFGGANVVDRSVVGGIERAADILGHLDVLLHSSAGDKGRIKAGKDFLQWQRNRDTVPVRFG